MKKISVALLFIIVLFTFAFCFVASASDLDDVDPNTSESHWAFIPGRVHMGTKNLSYSFSQSSYYTLYNANVIDGISLWGTNINMSYTGDTSSAGLIFSVYDYPGYIAAATEFDTYDHSTGHITKCHIYFDSSIFPDLLDTIKAITIAHELGHVYGLNHVNDSNSIMYSDYINTMSVTSNDMWGMKVVTHAHTHGTVVMGTVYEVIDASYHNVTCNSCKGKIKRIHAPNGYGVCACGYTGPFLHP